MTTTGKIALSMATLALSATAALAAAPAAPTASPVDAWQITLYTKDAPPKTPALEDLPLTAKVSQYGVTWTFEKPVRAGRFVNGDWYVVGPVKIVGITPEPKDGRNGSCLNPRATIERAGFDSRMLYGRYDGNLFLAPPISLKPGDSLLSSISHEDAQIGKTKPMLWRADKDQRSPVRTVAVLTCLAAPVPADAFRPAYGGGGKVYLARDLKRELLPKLSRAGIALTCHQGKGPDPAFKLDEAAGWFRRPWIDLTMDEFSAPVDSMPVYGQEFCRAVGMGSLLLCLDFAPQEKEPVLIGLVQIGIDLWGLAGQGSQPTPWNAIGGHANGRKWPIVFAGLLLDDADMQQPQRKYSYLRFSEDTQTMFGPCWTGAKVVWAGHVGKDGSTKYPDWGAYEHLQPKDWKGKIGESYRRCCTSKAWVAEALAARILHAEKVWDHDAFFAYVDRWMTENDSEFVKIIQQQRGEDYGQDWQRQGEPWDPFVKDCWKKYRDSLPPAADGKPTPKSTETWK